MHVADLPSLINRSYLQYPSDRPIEVQEIVAYELGGIDFSVHYLPSEKLPYKRN
jgi:hypothetical protein